MSETVGPPGAPRVNGWVNPGLFRKVAYVTMVWPGCQLVTCQAGLSEHVSATALSTWPLLNRTVYSEGGAGLPPHLVRNDPDVSFVSVKLKVASPLLDIWTLASEASSPSCSRISRSTRYLPGGSSV